MNHTQAATNHKPGPPAGILYVVATPIGNLEDITLRAIRILNEVSLVAAEDTRHTRKLLAHLGIKTPLCSYYKDREAGQAEQIINKILDGSNVALVSDAGTPAISDPGAILVKKCHEQNITVVPLPGPSALTALVSAAGFPVTDFTFIGFLPTKAGQKKKKLTALAGLGHPFIFYESPRRLLKTLADCRQIMGERNIFIGRELSKIHEELLSGSLSVILETLTDRRIIKGECVVAVEPGEKSSAPETADLDDIISWHQDNGTSLRDAVKTIAADLNLAKTEVYSRALQIYGKKKN
jgi:16S rRNA (cytidine1402-2'-O)-methyltransferase